MTFVFFALFDMQITGCRDVFMRRGQSAGSKAMFLFNLPLFWPKKKVQLEAWKPTIFNKSRGKMICFLSLSVLKVCFPLSG
jgi:hypothetical protein